MGLILTQDLKQYLVWDVDAEEDIHDTVTSQFFEAAERDESPRKGKDRKGKSKKTKKNKGGKSKKRKSSSTSCASSESSVVSSEDSSEPWYHYDVFDSIIFI